LELINPRPYTQIKIGNEVVRSFMHQGVYSKSFSEFYGSDVGYGFLKYTDPLGSPQEIFVWFGYPDYDQSSYTINYQVRPAVQDEISPILGIAATSPEEIIKGEISNIYLQVYGVNGG